VIVGVEELRDYGDNACGDEHFVRPSFCADLRYAYRVETIIQRCLRRGG
jgi:hypothetical protein